MPTIASLLSTAFRRGVVCVDELSQIRGDDSLRSRAVRALRARHPLGATGTPISNYVNDCFWGLWWALGNASTRFPYKGKVKLTGLGLPSQMRKFVKDGRVEEFELWVPENVGYLAGYAAAALVSGQITGREGEKFKAGKLGSRTIGKNGEVILGPPTKFNAKNIDKYQF